MKKLNWFVVVLLLVVAGVHFAAAHVTQHESIVRDFDVNGINLLSVVTDHGDIVVKTGGARIQMAIVRNATAETENKANAILNHSAVYVHRVGNRLSIESPNPKGVEGYSVNYELTVPVGIPLDLKTDVGKVTCKDRKSPFKVESGLFADVTIGDKEVVATLHRSNPDSAHQALLSTSTFFKINAVLNRLLNSIPSVTN